MTGRRRWTMGVIPGAVLSITLACTSRHRAGPQENALAQAIVTRDVAEAKRAIAAGVDYEATVEVRGRFPTTLVRILVEEVDPLRRGGPQIMEIATAAFAAGANPNSSERNRYLIEDAVVTKNVGLIEIMIKAGLEMKGPGTSRALVEACRNGDTAVVQRLVAAGADVNYKRKRYGVYWTPLSDAVHGRHLEIIDLLERAGAKEW